MEMDKGLTKQINEHVWMLRDDHNDTCYLVVGKEKALMIDTMSGYLNVREAAEKITDLPILVANTHGHGDHVFGNVWFEEAMMHPLDLPMVEQMLAEPEVKDMMEKEKVRMSKFKPIQEGDTIDLGGLTVEVLELPGHTPGGLCFLLKEDRMLFTGDSINRHLWMQLDGCLTLKEYAEKLERLFPVKEKADYILHGHAGDVEPINLIDELYQGLLDTVAGKTGQDTDYKWFGGVCRQHPFAENSVIVYGDNIQ